MGESKTNHMHHKDRDREQELTHLFVHFNVKAVGHLIILKQREKKNQSYQTNSNVNIHKKTSSFSELNLKGKM